MFSPEERQRTVDLYSTEPPSTTQMVKTPRLSDQAVLETLACDGPLIC